MIKYITQTTLIFLLGTWSLCAQEASLGALELTPGVKVKRKQSVLVQSKVTKIWGAEASVGTAEGEFSQNNFVQTNTTSSYSLNNWSAVTITDANNSGNGGNAYWTRYTTGESMGSFWGVQSAMASPTVSNGHAIFDSDFLDSDGIGVLGSGSAPGPHEGWLVSPRIDLTGYTDTVLTVKFYSKWRAFDVTNFTVSLSTDDGVTWEERNIKPLLPSLDGLDNEGWVKAIFPTTGMGVANMTACRIRFRFNGYYYYSMVDDVTVEVTPDWDLAIGPNDLTATNVVDNSIQVQVMNNRHIPVGGIDAPNDFVYGVNIRNRGGKDDHALLGSDLLAVVSRWDQANGWVEVHRDSTEIQDIPVGGTAFVTDTMTDFSWAIVGRYILVYTIRQQYDANFSDNELLQYFDINDDTYASKVAIDPSGGPQASAPIFPAGSAFEKFEYGSLFTFDMGGTNELRLDSISQAFVMPSNYTGAMNIKYRVNFSEWTDNDASSTIDPSELTLVASGLDSVDLSGFQGFTYFWNRSALYDVNTGILGYNLNDNKKYLAMVSLEAADNGMTEFTSSNMIWIGTSSSVNYGGNYTFSEGKAHVLSLINAGGIEEINDIGFGARRVPAMGLHLDQACFQVDADMDFDEAFLEVDFTDVSTATPGAESWVWDFGDGNTSTDQNPTHSYAAPGEYTVCLTATNLCSADTICDTVEVFQNTASLSDTWMDQVIVYPVPAEDFVTIQNIPGGMVAIELRNVVGQIVYERTFETNEELNVPVVHLAAGQYNLVIDTVSGTLVKNMLIR